MCVLFMGIRDNLDSFVGFEMDNITIFYLYSIDIVILIGTKVKEFIEINLVYRYTVWCLHKSIYSLALNSLMFFFKF